MTEQELPPWDEIRMLARIDPTIRERLQDALEEIGDELDEYRDYYHGDPKERANRLNLRPLEWP